MCDLDSAPERPKTGPRTSASAGLPETCTAKTLSLEVPEMNEPYDSGTCWEHSGQQIVTATFQLCQKRKRMSRAAGWERGVGVPSAWLQASGVKEWDPLVPIPIGQYLSRVVQKWKRQADWEDRPPPDKALHMRANSNNTSTTCSKTLLMCVCF